MEPLASRCRRSSSRRPELAAAAAFVLLAALAIFARPGRAQAPTGPGGAPTIVIGGAGTQRFAIPDCVPRRGDDASREACRTLTQVLRHDIDFEHLFTFVPDNLMNALPPLDPENPNLANWRSVSADILVVTRAEAGAQLAVDAKVYSVGSGQVMMARRYTGGTARGFAHSLSDDIMTLTQYRGIARTKIAFTSDRDATGARRTKELYIVDYDGFNPRRMTVNSSINLLPNWAPDGRSLAYVSYRQGVPDVFMAWIYEGRSANLTGGKGQNFAPSISPDGKRIAYASSRSGNMEIWVASIDGSNPRKLTSSSGLDTAPAFSPTGQEIAFTSDRTGQPQIYVMSDEGLNVRRLTTVGNYNDAPTWNPSKQNAEVAYTSRLEGGFEVAVVDLATNQVRQITEGRGSCESPTWSPNGRHLGFACSRGGAWQIAVADRDGRNFETLSAGPGNNTQPDWSP